MKIFWMVAGVALASAAVASAQDESGGGASKDEKLVCKTERVTGSRTRTNRVCMTEAQWKALADATKQKVDDFQRNTTLRRDGQGQSNPGGGM